MNDARWSMTSALLFLGVASLIGGSLVCAAGAPFVLQDLAVIDFMHLLLHLQQGVILLGVASVCMIGALACALALDGWRRPPTMRAPRAWNSLWGVRSNPLDARRFTQSQRVREAVLQSGGPVSVHSHAPESVFTTGREAIAIALGERAPAFARPAIRHSCVRGER